MKTKKMDLNAQEAHLLAVLSSQRFLKMEGLSNEVPFFIYPFPPEAALVVAQAKKRIKTKLSTKQGITVHEVNLYDLSLEILKERGVWERVLAFEPDHDKDDFREMLQAMLDPQLHIAPALRENLEGAGRFDIVFLTGIGEEPPLKVLHPRSELLGHETPLPEALLVRVQVPGRRRLEEDVERARLLALPKLGNGLNQARRRDHGEEDRGHDDVRTRVHPHGRGPRTGSRGTG